MEHKSNNSRKRMFNVFAHHIEKLACWGPNQYFFLSIMFPLTALKIETLPYNVISVKTKLDLLFNYQDSPKKSLAAHC